MKKFQILFKWFSLTFIFISFFSMTLGQVLPIEFISPQNKNIFYDIFLKGLPLAIILTLIWTLKKDNSQKKNIITSTLTISLSGLMIFITMFLMLLFVNGNWENTRVIYQNKDNPKQTINNQRLDLGAFGSDIERTVKITPFLGMWKWVEEINILKVNKEEWLLVDR